MSVFDDLNAITTEVLGDPVVIQKNGYVFHGLLEKDYVETGDISGFSPVLTCLSSDSESLVRNDLLEIEQKLYLFILEEPDGTGVSRLILEDASA